MILTVSGRTKPRRNAPVDSSIQFWISNRDAQVIGFHGRSTVTLKTNVGDIVHRIKLEYSHLCDWGPRNHSISCLVGIGGKDLLCRGIWRAIGLGVFAPTSPRVNCLFWVLVKLPPFGRPLLVRHLRSR